MPKTIKYIGTQDGWAEIAVTGRPSNWKRGAIDERSDLQAAQLLATGLFTDVDATLLPEQKVVALSGVVSGDGIVVHPNLWHQSFAGLSVADDPVVRDLSGNERHAVPGANLALANLHGASGYHTTQLVGTNGHDASLAMPSINFDYDGGEILLAVLLFKMAAPAADGHLLANSSSATYNGFRIRARTTGYIDCQLFSTTGAVSSASGNSINVLLDGTLHQLAILIDGRNKNRSFWEDGTLTRDGVATLATCDTRESNPLRNGGVPPMTAISHTSATVIRAQTIMRWGPNDTAPTDAAITALCARLRRDPGRPVVKGEV